MSLASDKNNENQAKEKEERVIKEPENFANNNSINWEEILLEYDINNDGNLSWNEFCRMCIEKKISNKNRNEFFKIFGGEPNNINSKISIKQIKNIKNKQQKQQKLKVKFNNLLIIYLYIYHA